MNRREALNRVAILMGTTVVGGAAFLEGCNSGDKKVAATAAAGIPFSAESISFLDEVAETIIPTTNTPGAKAAKVGAFMNTMVTDCYDEKNQKIFTKGLTKIDEASQKKFSTTFAKATPEQRKELLTEIDKEATAYNKSKKPEDPSHYFSLMKQLTLLGYFSSEIGATQALRYVAVPGRYEGCIPYKKGDKAWAT
jgi:Gluconate 2-dehydrogenase subunit 3